MRILALSNVFDDQYQVVRGESVDRCLSSAKRRDLFQCLEIASGRELIVLSSPPKARDRTSPKWLPAQETRFSTHRQFFSANWDIKKLRIPFSWILYARHVLRHTQDGDLLLIDNYELIYIIAALFTRLFRRVSIILDYEDGKHLIDRGWARLISRFAEFLGRPLLCGALLAHPGLAKRLPVSLPTELVPGFIVPKYQTIIASLPIRFLYSGTLDQARGVDLILQAIELLSDSGWHLDVTGMGVYESEISRVASSSKYAGRVTYHGALNQYDYDLLVSNCHIGLNCQREGDPISRVTFPSKIFSYLSSGLTVLSSRASDVTQICGNALLYFEENSAESLSTAMQEIIDHPNELKSKVDIEQACQHYSMENTSKRIRGFLNFFLC